MLDECVHPLGHLRRCECLLAEVAGERGRQRLTVNLIARVAGSFFVSFYGTDQIVRSSFFLKAEI
jgi:hypothetical protein